MNLSHFYNLHKGETCLIVGLGPNLKLTPPGWFDYPSFSVNTIYRYEGWKPTYFVGVDHRLMVEDGAAIAEKYRDIPKFVPAPDYDELQGENFYRFKHRTGELAIGGQTANAKDALTRVGIGYYKVMDAVFQIAYHMGFTTMLMIGVQHNPENKLEQFWGQDERAHQGEPLHFWYIGYQHWAHSMGSTRVLNISEDTYVPDDVLPRDDWRKWATHETANLHAQ